ncbi:hypothetical protein BS78_03G301600 [Paspalum vaginatum]|nr:hypothetical protein BS78_03G301600 [Paspalum vaginatum]
MKGWGEHDLNVCFFDGVQLPASVVVEENTFCLLRTEGHSRCEAIKLIDDELIPYYFTPSRTFMVPPMTRTRWYYQPTFVTLECLESYGSEDLVANSRDYFLVSSPYFEENHNGQSRLTSSPIFTQDNGKPGNNGFAMGFVLQDCHRGNQMKVAIKATRFNVIKRELMRELDQLPPPPPPRRKRK